MKLKFFLISMLLFSVGAAETREFPLCLYGVDNPADVKIVRKAGFSCLQTYKQDPAQLEKLAQTAKKYGLKTVFSPNKVWGSEYESKAQTWPMLAWYLVDEPDVHHWSRERVTAAHQRAKNTWSKHSTTLVIGQGKTKIHYYDIPDVMMVDWYPVSHLPLGSFGDNVCYTKEGMALTHHQDRPLWGVVQIFDWKEFKQYRPDNDRVGRFPTAQEIRFMSYHGIVNGATGLFYFVFRHKGIPMPQSSPTYWKRVQQVVRELAHFVPVLEEGLPVDNPVSVSAPLVMKTWKFKGNLYSVLLNVSGESQRVPVELLNKPYKPLYGTRKQAWMPPYAVWVFKKK